MSRLSAWVQAQFQSEFRRNALWFTGLTGFQRVAAMVQTILIARALGITEYSSYGLMSEDHVKDMVMSVTNPLSPLATALMGLASC